MAPCQSRIGLHLARQFLSIGDDTITLSVSGTLPTIAGSRQINSTWYSPTTVSFIARPPQQGYYNPDEQKGAGVKSRDLIKELEAEGWELDRIKGSHHHFRHPNKPGTITVPHPKKDLKKGLIQGIRKQAGLI